MSDVYAVITVVAASPMLDRWDRRVGLLLAAASCREQELAEQAKDRATELGREQPRRARDAAGQVRGSVSPR